jgi:hypothetical protein
MRSLLLLLTALVVASKAGSDAAAVSPSVVLGSRCHMLCDSGLGGVPCGCPAKIVTSQLHNKMNAWRLAHPDRNIIKGPRHELCKSLCSEGLGQPLCRCTSEVHKEDIQISKDWCPICHDILLREQSPKLWMELRCNELHCWNNTEQKPIRKREVPKTTSKYGTKFNIPSNAIGVTEINDHSLMKDEEEVDWNLWCEVECDENNGGLACNCDMLPLSLT